MPAMQIPDDRLAAFAAAVGAAVGIAIVLSWKPKRRAARKLLNLSDFEVCAKQMLQHDRFEWIAEGAADGYTIRDNCNSWASPGLELMPRGAVDVSAIDLTTTLVGETMKLKWPVLVAPTSYQKLAHDDGELASVRAAAKTGTAFVGSHAMSYTSEDVVAAAKEHAQENAQEPLWQQMYFLSDRVKTLAFVRRIEKLGFTCLVPTIDHPVGGLRERSSQANFRFPRHVIWANLGISPSDWKASAGQVSPSVTWEDIEWLCGATSLPVFVKGVMCGIDAVKAVQCGAKGVIVSNHGGRQLDQGPSTVAMLPRVVQALRDAGLANHCDVLVDGGIRRGSDVVKALALGAKAVLIGRPVLWGLACDGEKGARSVLEILRRELEITLKLCGCTSVQDISECNFVRAH